MEVSAATAMYSGKPSSDYDANVLVNVSPPRALYAVGVKGITTEAFSRTRGNSYLNTARGLISKEI